MASNYIYKFSNSLEFGFFFLGLKRGIQMVTVIHCKTAIQLKLLLHIFF